MTPASRNSRAAHTLGGVGSGGSIAQPQGPREHGPQVESSGEDEDAEVRQVGSGLDAVLVVAWKSAVPVRT